MTRNAGSDHTRKAQWVTPQCLREELQRRALSLVKNLAHNSKYSILIEDRQILQELITGILREDSVLLIHISNAQGKVLA